MKAHADPISTSGHRSIKQLLVDAWRVIKISVQAAKQAQKRDPTREYMQRPARAVNMDGSAELGWGMFCLAAALVVHLESLRPRPHWLPAVSFGLLATMCLAPLLVPKLVKRFITWPRTGYVAFDPKNTRLARNLGLVLGAVGGVGLSLLWAAERQNGFLNPKAILSALAGVVLLVFAFMFFRVKKECDAAVAVMQSPAPPEPPVPAARTEDVTQPLPSPVLIQKVKAQVRIGILATFLIIAVVIPCVFGAIIYGWLHFALTHHVHQNLIQTIGMMSALVCNPILYFMINAVSIREHAWKWFGLLALAVGPLTIVTLFPQVWNELANSNVAVPNTLSFFISGVWLASGTLTLILYLLRHPKAQAAME